MSGTTKAEVAQQIIKETKAQADEINNIKHGTVTFTVQSGKLQRTKLEKTILPKE